MQAQVVGCSKSSHWKLNAQIRERKKWLPDKTVKSRTIKGSGNSPVYEMSFICEAGKSYNANMTLNITDPSISPARPEQVPRRGLIPRGNNTINGVKKNIKCGR